MKKLYRLSFVLLLLIATGTAAVARISIDDLIRERAFSTFRLSPDGSKLAFLGEVQEGFKNIYVINLESMESKLITGEEANVNSFVWANNNRLVYSTDGANRVFNGVYAINSDGTDAKILIEPVMTPLGSPFTGISLSGRLFSVFGDDDDHILLYSSSRRRVNPDISKLNVYTGRESTYFHNPGDYNGFSMDGDGVARFAYKFEEDGSSAVYYRDSDDDEFELFHAFSADYITYSVEGYDKENLFAYVITNHLDDTASLYKLDLANKTYELVYKDPVYDLSAFAAGGNLIFSSKSGKLLGIQYEAEKPVNKWFNKQFEQLQQMIDEAFPDTVNQLIDWDEDQTKFIIASVSDRQPYLYRLLTINPLSVTELQSSKPWINPKDLPKCKPIEYKSRDGVTIHGYLYLPTDYKKGDKVPLLMLPHGGPWARDLWGFRSYLDTLQIFPATRGWAVMQVNFRGSTGYGKEHLTASYKKPHEMNQDVEDGVQWAIDQGYADPDHVAIMGASWGGYATMYGVTITPDLYRFGVNIFGVVDVPRQINWYRLRTKWQGSRDSGYEAWVRRIGDPKDEKDLAMLDSASPINFIDRIKVPLIVYHGTADVNVDIEQSRILRSELDKHDIEFDWISHADEHHSIRNFENRKDLYERIERLLVKFGKDNKGK